MRATNAFGTYKLFSGPTLALHRGKYLFRHVFESEQSNQDL